MRFLNDSPERRILITNIHISDACYKNAYKYIGATGSFIPEVMHNNGYFTGHMTFDKPIIGNFGQMFFYKIRYKRI
jgi:hypothetical protein